jgi:hypothetical protein
MEVTKDTDVIWATLPYTEERMIKLLNLRKHWNCKLVIDIDDNLYAVPHNNVEQVKTAKLMPAIQASIAMADGVTVSVPRLQDVYKNLNKEFYVNNNGLDFDIWDKLKKTNKKHEGIRIGWRGASGHFDDLAIVKPVLKELQKNYPVTIVTLGEKMDEEYETHHWVGMLEYPQKLASMDLDIAVVPLVDSAYNRCKSNLCYLEFSALKVPTVLSPVENQKDHPTLYAKSKYEWYDQLEKLIKSSALRQELTQKNYDFVKENYNITQQVHPLNDWMNKLKRRTDLEP